MPDSDPSNSGSGGAPYDRRNLPVPMPEPRAEHRLWPKIGEEIARLLAPLL